MSFLNSHHELFNKAAATAMSAGGGKLQNSAFANTVLAPVLANHIPFFITPYLGLRAKLSQVWINRWTVLLMLVLVRSLISISSINDDIGSARREALVGCTSVESVGSAMASMPHYMAQGVNELTASGVGKAIDGLMSMLLLTVTGVEEIMVFIFNTLYSTYLCLATMVIAGSLHAAIALLEDVSGFLNKTLGDIGNDIQGAVTLFENGLDDVTKGINDVFGGKTIPQLNLNTQIEALKDFKLPTDFDSDLQTLNDNIPSFQQVQNVTDNIIRLPFELIKNLINESTGNYTFNRSVFPVPAKERLSFCSPNDGINVFFNGLVNLIREARKITVAVLVILAILVCGPMSYLEIRRHRKMQERAALFTAGNHEPMDVVYLASRPVTASVGLKLASTFKATRRQALIRWAIAYATTVPAIFVLSLGMAGLFSCLCRYIILVAVTKEVPKLANEVEGFAHKVVESLNDASASWANGTNSAILDVNTRINHDVFGWVNTSTHAIDDAIDSFIDTTIHVLNETFGGTILYDPATELFNCTIGLKAASIEKALNWVSDHAYIEFPLLPNNTFSLGAAASISGNGTSGSDAQSFLTDPATGASDAVSGPVDILVQHLANSIRTEALISTGVVCVWVIIALIGIIRALTLFYGHKGSGDNDSTHSTPSFVSEGRFPKPTLPDVGSIHSEKSPTMTMQPKNDRESGKQGIALQPIPTFNLQPPSSNTSIHNTSPHPVIDPNPFADVNRLSNSNLQPRTSTNSANTYRGAPYTLVPRPFPRFPVNTGLPATPHQPGTGAIKFAGKRDVGGAIVQRPDHQRQSSHADLSGVKGHGRAAFEGLGQ